MPRRVASLARKWLQRLFRCFQPETEVGSTQPQAQSETGQQTETKVGSAQAQAQPETGQATEAQQPKTVQIPETVQAAEAVQEAEQVKIAETGEAAQAQPEKLQTAAEDQSKMVQIPEALQTSEAVQITETVQIMHIPDASEAERHAEEYRDLPYAIVLEILRKLPVDKIAQCKTLCKSCNDDLLIQRSVPWLSLTYRQGFVSYSSDFMRWIQFRSTLDPIRHVSCSKGKLCCVVGQEVYLWDPTAGRISLEVAALWVTELLYAAMDESRLLVLVQLRNDPCMHLLERPAGETCFSEVKSAVRVLEVDASVQHMDGCLYSLGHTVESSDMRIMKYDVQTRVWDLATFGLPHNVQEMFCFVRPNIMVCDGKLTIVGSTLEENGYWSLVIWQLEDDWVVVHEEQADAWSSITDFDNFSGFDRSIVTLQLVATGAGNLIFLIQNNCGNRYVMGFDFRTGDWQNLPCYSGTLEMVSAFIFDV